MNKKQPSYRWIKKPMSYLDDPDYMRLSLEGKGLYTDCYLLAGRGEMAGLIGMNDKLFNLNDIGWFLHQPGEKMATVMAELLQSGLVKREGDGYLITRFMDEQGAEDDENRARWRDYQRQRRAKVLNLPEQELEQESEEEKKKRREELEKRREEERERRGRVSSDNVPLSLDNDEPPPPAASFSLPEEHPAVLLWLEVVKPATPLSESDKQLVIDKLGDTPDRDGLDEALTEWVSYAAGKTNKNGKPYNLTYLPGILELYRETAITYKDCADGYREYFRGSQLLRVTNIPMLTIDGGEFSPGGERYTQIPKEERNVTLADVLAKPGVSPAERAGWKILTGETDSRDRGKDNIHFSNVPEPPPGAEYV